MLASLQDHSSLTHLPFRVHLALSSYLAALLQSLWMALCLQPAQDPAMCSLNPVSLLSTDPNCNEILLITNCLCATWGNANSVKAGTGLSVMPNLPQDFL